MQAAQIATAAAYSESATNGATSGEMRSLVRGLRLKAAVG